MNANPLMTYDAIRTVLAPHLDIGTFTVYLDEPGKSYGISSRTMAGSAHYRFELEQNDGGTRLRIILRLSGFLGPIHMVLRRKGNKRHINHLIDTIKLSAESSISAKNIDTTI